MFEIKLNELDHFTGPNMLMCVMCIYGETVLFIAMCHLLYVSYIVQDFSHILFPLFNSLKV